MEKTEIVAIFMVNSKGDFFVHQRLGSKKTFPNKFGIGAGGHIDHGESPNEAACRELQEETGLQTPVHFICKVEFDDTDFQQVSYLFVTKSEGPIQTDKNEWQWSGWMSKPEVDKLVQEGKLCIDTAEMYRRYILSIM